MLMGLGCQVRGLTGPWIHKYPHLAKPEPAVGFLQDSLAWWDHWLKGKDNGVMDKPLYHVYMMDGVRPQPFYEVRPGRWIAESEWPSANVQHQQFYLNIDGLSESPGLGVELPLCSPENVGVACGEYCAMWQGPESPTDQRHDDAGSLVFDSELLQAPAEILGAPVVDLDIVVDKPQANIAVRLCDVWPTGESTRVTYGILNLCHRDGHESPRPLTPGERYRVRIQLDDIAYRIPAGNRIRVALSTAYWPLIWPAAEHVSATVHSTSSILKLPLRSPAHDDPPELPSPVTAPPPPMETLRPPSNVRTVEHDLVSGQTVMRIYDDFGEHKDLTHGLTTGHRASECYRIHADDTSTCQADIQWTQTIAREGWSIRTETKTLLRSDVNNFYVTASIEAFEGGDKVYERHWDRRVKRDLV